MTEHRPPLPPFDMESATLKVRLAEDAWNSRDPSKVALAYTKDSRWRNRVEFIEGRDAIEALLARKWKRELEYRLIKELWGFRENRMAVRFAYECHDDSGHWFRSYGNELWEFDENGLMRRRVASINDLPISESTRKFHWPLGRRAPVFPNSVCRGRDGRFSLHHQSFVTAPYLGLGRMAARLFVCSRRGAPCKRIIKCRRTS